MGLFSPRLGRVEFWAGAVGGRGHGGPKFLGRCRGGARAIAAVKSLLLKFWDQIPTGIQIPGGDSSPLGVSCLRWVFPVSSGLGLVLFWIMEVFGASEHCPTLRLGSCPIPGAFGIPVPFFLQFHGVWRPLISPPSTIPCLSHCWQLTGSTNPINPIPSDPGWPRLRCPLGTLWIGGK